MSTLSSQVSKGEKQKSKFQSLDINKIYRGTRGENSEKTQQKSAAPYRHGMQILGKVPNARRPPANLPSLKSEHNGSEAAVPLVPPGGPGWGKQDSASNGLPPSKTDSHQATTPISNPGQPSSQISVPKQEVPHVPIAPVDKSWSSVMSRGDPHSHHPPPYQGAQFQHDFPSLSSASDASQSGRGGDAYSAGLSLRPQTEGSWIGGGSGPGLDGKHASGHLGPPPQLSAQVGLAQQQLPPQFRGVMPSFMYKNSPPLSNSSVNQHSTASAFSHDTPPIRHEKPVYNQKSYVDIVPPSIIKEEELHRMDEIEGDMGWAYSDDIDYNKKLSFSDDEILSDKNAKTKRNYNTKNERASQAPKREADSWHLASKEHHSSEEEDIKNKRNQHFKEVELVVQRAKQRKKEEEKRFSEATKQGAKQKLKELEEKISKRDRDGDEGVGTINPSTVPSKTIATTEIPLPDFQKEKISGNDDRSRMSVDNHEEKAEKPLNTFKQMTEIEGKTSFRRPAKNLEREPRDQGVPTFSRQFQSNLPPRFKRQNIQPQFNDHFDNRTPSQNYPKTNNNLRRDHDVKKEDSPPIPYTPSDMSRKSESPYASDSYNQSGFEFDEAKHKKEEKIDEKPAKIDFDKKDYYNQQKSRENIAETKSKNHRNQDNNLYDRFQRLDSQESKISKYSSDYNSWAESKYETPFEERRRDLPREDRRQVPGPITRDRIEADDVNETRNLTALKRGQIPEKKGSEIKNKDMKYSETLDSKNSETTDSKVWLDYSDKSKGNNVKRDDKDNNKLIDSTKKNVKHDDYKDDKRMSNRNKMYSQNKVWNNEYHHRSSNDRGNWNKKPNPTNKNVKTSAGHTTDSEGSSEDHLNKDEKNVRSDRGKNHAPKDDRRSTRSDKERSDKSQDLKKDNYVPRGEPSRHGRGGGNFRGRVGIGKRFDGYGPPPSKSPFPHHEDKKFDHDLDRGNVEIKDEDKISENKDDKDKSRMNKNIQKSGSNANVSRKPQMRSANDKKAFPGKIDVMSVKQETKTDETNILCTAIADISLKIKDELVDDLDDDELLHDSDGFQEVKSRKTVKDRPKVDEKPATAPAVFASGKTTAVDNNKDKDKLKKAPQQPPIQQPTHNIPPLMATPVNPPHVLPNAGKIQYDRQNRQNKIAPRFAKLRDYTRLQKMQQQQHVMVDINSDMKNRNMFNSKMPSNSGNVPPVVPMTNAWDKPLSTQLRPMDTENLLGGGAMDNGNVVEHASQQDVDKKMNKPVALSDAAILDGATPPKTTIIFENTNFKTVPTNRNMRNDKMRKDDAPSGGNALENSTMSNFNKPMVSDLLNKNDKQTDSIQLQLPFKEDGGDMKLDFFDSDLTLTDEKTIKTPCLGRSMHSTMTAGGNNISTADALNFKIQSVKKVWETPSEHSVPQEDTNTSFTSSFVPDPNSLDSSSFVKGNDNMDDNQEQHVYNPAANQQTSNNTTNVCKVKPTQQVSGANNQTVPNTSGTHAAHSGMMGPGLMGNPLSPPPIQPVIGAGVGIGQPPQQYPTNQHIGYQTGLGSSNQYGMSTIPSPPSVLPYTAQPLQAQTANLYGPFQIDQSGVLGGQGRSQFSQYTNHYGLGQAASSAYSAQSMFLQPAQAHPQQAAQGPEMYQNMNNYRLPTGPFGQSQQLNNPTTVLISSTSNSLMSASVKPSTQQISAIGTKSGGVGQAYQPQSQQGQQMFMFDPNIPANYIQGMQRPAGPVQNNVVPTIQPSSSYYSGSTGTAKQFNCSWRF